MAEAFHTPKRPCTMVSTIRYYQYNKKLLIRQVPLTMENPDKNLPMYRNGLLHGLAKHVTPRRPFTR